MNSHDPRSIRLVLNGKASGNASVRKAVDKLREMGNQVEVRVTWEEGDAARYAVQAINDGTDVIVAAGGDGTVNEVASGVISFTGQHDSSIAVVPLGTANDFANGCGITIGDPLAALELAANGNIVPIDIGKVNNRHFINVASGGFGAEVTTNTPPELKDAMGGAAYGVMGIATASRMTPNHCRVTFDDGSIREGNLFVMAVGNGRQAGGGQQVAPKAILDDGLLDVMIIHDVDLLTFGSLLNEWVKLGDESNQIVSYTQVESFRIECEQPLQVNLDGEPIRETLYDFRAIPKALRIALPASAPLLANAQ